MVPNMHIHEQFMFERVRERQRKREHQHLLAGLRKPRPSCVRRLIGSPGLFFTRSGEGLANHSADEGNQTRHE